MKRNDLKVREEVSNLKAVKTLKKVRKRKRLWVSQGSIGEETMQFNFKKEDPCAKLPTRHTEYSAGVDFYAADEVYIPRGQSRIVSTGVSWNPVINRKLGFPASVCLIIQSRSGLAFKEEIEASNAGVIDQDYVSNKYNKAVIKVKLYNNSKKNKRILLGDKICQGVPQLVPYFDDVVILDNNRNGLGFGSSDEKE